MSGGDETTGALPRAAVRAVAAALDARGACMLAQTCRFWRDACSGAHSTLWRTLYFREYPRSHRQRPPPGASWKDALLRKHNLAAQLAACARLIAAERERGHTGEAEEEAEDGWPEGWPEGAATTVHPNDEEEEEDVLVKAAKAEAAQERARRDPVAAAEEAVGAAEALVVAAARLGHEAALEAGLRRLERAAEGDEARVVAGAGRALRAAAAAGARAEGTLRRLLALVPRCAAARGADGASALHVAATRGAAMALLRAGCAGDVRDAGGRAAIHRAAALGHVETVRCLLDPASIACATARGGDTALHVACAAGQLGVVRLLVAVGASVRCQNAAGQCPLHAAARGNHAAVAEYLVARGSPVGVVDRDGNTPLDVAAAAGHLDMVEFLLDKDNKLVAPAAVRALARTPIGAGAFGEVFRATLHGRRVAVKHIRSAELLRAQRPRAWIRQRFLLEAALTSKLGAHPRFPALIAASRTAPDADDYWLVLEYAAGGSVFDLVHGARAWVTPPTANAVAVGLVDGMAHLHSRVPQIIHRDLTSANVLLTATGDVKITDLGISRFKPAPADCPMTAIGNPRWRAPEITRGEPYGAKADVYSFAIVLWEMAAAALPFADRNSTLAAVAAANGERPPIPPDCPSDWASIIQQCWHPDPLQRPSFAELRGVVPALSPMHIAISTVSSVIDGFDSY